MRTALAHGRGTEGHTHTTINLTLLQRRASSCSELGRVLNCLSRDAQLAGVQFDQQYVEKNEKTLMAFGKCQPGLKQPFGIRTRTLGSN